MAVTTMTARFFYAVAQRLPGGSMNRGHPNPGVDTRATVQETVYQMVNLRQVRLDRTFGALGDSTRRMILARQYAERQEVKPHQTDR